MIRNFLEISIVCLSAWGSAALKEVYARVAFQVANPDLEEMLRAPPYRHGEEKFERLPQQVLSNQQPKPSVGSDRSLTASAVAFPTFSSSSQQPLQPQQGRIGYCGPFRAREKPLSVRQQPAGGSTHDTGVTESAKEEQDHAQEEIELRAALARAQEDSLPEAEQGSPPVVTLARPEVILAAARQAAQELQQQQQQQPPQEQRQHKEPFSSPSSSSPSPTPAADLPASATASLTASTASRVQQDCGSGDVSGSGSGDANGIGSGSGGGGGSTGARGGDSTESSPVSVFSPASAAAFAPSPHVAAAFAALSPEMSAVGAAALEASERAPAACGLGDVEDPTTSAATRATLTVSASTFTSASPGLRLDTSLPCGSPLSRCSPTPATELKVDADAPRLASAAIAEPTEEADVQKGSARAAGAKTAVSEEPSGDASLEAATGPLIAAFSAAAAAVGVQVRVDHVTNPRGNAGDALAPGAGDDSLLHSHVTVLASSSSQLHSQTPTFRSLAPPAPSRTEDPPASTLAPDQGVNVLRGFTARYHSSSSACNLSSSQTHVDPPPFAADGNFGGVGANDFGFGAGERPPGRVVDSGSNGDSLSGNARPSPITSRTSTCGFTSDGNCLPLGLTDAHEDDCGNGGWGLCLIKEYMRQGAIPTSRSFKMRCRGSPCSVHINDPTLFATSSAGPNVPAAASASASGKAPLSVSEEEAKLHIHVDAASSSASAAAAQETLPERPRPSSPELTPGSLSAWRLTGANRKYRLCDSYPSVLAVPAAIDDKTLHEARTFRCE